MSYALSGASKDNIHGVDSRLLEITELAITFSPIDYGHGPDSGLRTDSEQLSLFERKLSLADGTINKSKHQSGKALDFYAYVNGKASWDHEHLMAVACAMFQAAAQLGYRIRWGGFFRTSSPVIKNGISYGWDCAHIELLD